MSRDPEAVLVVKVFASPDAEAPVAEVEAEIHRDRITTYRTGDLDAVKVAAEALQVAAGDDGRGDNAPAYAAGIGGVLLGALLGGGEG